MTIRNLQIAVLLGAVLTTATAWTQVLTSDANTDVQAPTSSPVAFIYVSNTPSNGNTNQIVAYSAASNGSLTPIPGSPFPDNVFSMAVNGKYLMGASQTVPNINAYNIAPNGALSFATSTNYAQFNNPPTGCGVAGQVFFDHTGASLYVQEFNGSDACTNTVVASFNVVKSTGSLPYLGTDVTGAFPGLNTGASFTGNNLYAYAAANSACMYYSIYGFKRDNNGMLNQIGVKANLPTPPNGTRAYIPSLADADPSNHVAFTMQPANPPGCTPGPIQLASYTVDANGNLHTTNTGANMPSTLIASPFDLKMSPSGKLLAVAGGGGLQVFHFRGALPIKTYTGLLTADTIDQMFWDNNHHLYAISHGAGKLYVFTVTATSYSMAPGSPYTISNPEAIIVQPLPLF